MTSERDVSYYYPAESEENAFPLFLYWADSFYDERSSVSILHEIDLTFEFGMTLGEHSWTSTPGEMTTKELGVILQACEDVMEDTSGAISLACSGPTTVDAAIALQNKFKCQCSTCNAKSPVLLNLIMPTLVDEKRKDYCHACLISTRNPTRPLRRSDSV